MMISSQNPDIYSYICLLQTVDEFHQQLELICGSQHLDILLKKPDKKKER